MPDSALPALTLGGIMKLDRFLRRTEVEALTGLSRSALYREMEAGRFPQSIPLTARAVVWRESEIAAWQQTVIERALAA